MKKEIEKPTQEKSKEQLACEAMEEKLRQTEARLAAVTAELVSHQVGSKGVIESSINQEKIQDFFKSQSLPFSNVALLIADENRIVRQVSPELPLIFNLEDSPDQLLQKPIQEVFNTLDSVFLKNNFLSDLFGPSLKAESPQTISGLQLKNGRVLELSYLQVNGQNQFKGNIWWFKDVTNEQNLKEYLHQLVGLPYDNPNPILRFNASGSILFTNRAAEPIRSELNSPQGLELKKTLQKEIEACLQKNRRKSLELTSNKRVYVWCLVPVPSENYVNAYLADITERKYAEDSFKDSWQFIEKITNTVPNIIYVYDTEENNILYTNSQVKLVLGYSAGEYIYNDEYRFINLIHPEDLNLMFDHFKTVNRLLDGEVAEVEFRMKHKNGSWVWLSSRDMVFNRKSNGSVRQIIGSAENITEKKLINQRLADQKEFYETILNHIPLDIAVFSPDHRYIYINPPAIQNKELRQWIIGKTDFDYCSHMGKDKEIAEVRHRNFEKLLLEKRPILWEEKQHTKSGEEIFKLRSLSPVFELEGDIKFVIGTGINITERKQSEELIKESEAKIRALVEAIPDSMLIIDRDGVILGIKADPEHATLAPELQHPNTSVFETFDPDIAQVLHHQIEKVLKNGRLANFELELIQEGQPVYFENQLVKYTDDQVLLISRDITDRKNALITLQDQKTFIRQIIDTAPNLILVKNKYGEYLLVNKAFSELMGRPFEEIDAPANLDHLFLLQESRSFKGTDLKVINSGQEISLEEQLTTKTGKRVWLHTIKRPIVRADGEVLVLGICTDITAIKEAQEKLQESEEQYRLLSENSRDLICLHARDGRFLFVSKSVKEILGFEPEELIGLPVQNFVHPEDLPDISRLNVNLLHEAETNILEYRMLMKNGKYVWMEMYTKPILDETGGVLRWQSSSRDITERKKNEAIIRKTEKSYRDIFNYTQAYIYSHDLSGRILSVNPSLETLLGYGKDEWQFKNLQEFIPSDHLEYVENYLEFMKTHSQAEGIFCVLDRQGNRKYLLYQNYKTSESGNEPYIAGFAQDITDRLKAEKELKKAKQLAEESVKAKENFLANMSHEIRTPMNGILGMAGLISKTALTEAQQHYISIIKTSAQNLLVIINDILDMAKIESGHLELEEIPFNLNELLITLKESLWFEANEKGIQLEVAPADLPHPVLIGDPYRLNQILLNLLHNAVKFTHEGLVQLNIKVLKQTKKAVSLEFSVSDTGIGIPEDKLQTVFEGFTQAYSNTTRQYGGTGLGLTICKNLIERQGGSIYVESKVGQGSTFYFTLDFKLNNTKKTKEEPHPEPDFHSLGRLRVLLAEDNLINQFVAQSILESWGFEVHTASNGKEAIALFDQNSFDIVLMDIQMPEMNGVEATAYIRHSEDRVKAQTPVIALTANALKGDDQKFMVAGMNDYLSKPFEEETLFEKISANLKPREILMPVSETAAIKKLYNLNALKNRSYGNADFIRKMLLLFVNTMPQHLAELEEQVKAENWQEISAIAHRIRPSVEMMGITSLRNILFQLEEDAREEQNLETVITETRKVIDTLYAILDQIKKEELDAPVN